jgi:hypothetical protein
MSQAKPSVQITEMNFGKLPGSSPKIPFDPAGKLGVVRSARLERATDCLEGSCSIHLSYERNSLFTLSYD